MENLHLFIRSVFIDNMIFAYFLGMCSYLAVSKNVKTAFGLGIAVTFMLVITLPLDYILEMYFLRPGALAWLSPEFVNVDLSFLSLILFIAVIAAATQLVQLRHSWMFAVHATKRFRLRAHRDSLRRRIGPWVAACHCRHCGDSRTSRLLQRAGSFKRHWYHFHHNRTDGHRVHEFPRY